MLKRTIIEKCDGIKNSKSKVEVVIRHAKTLQMIHREMHLFKVVPVHMLLSKENASFRYAVF